MFGEGAEDQTNFGYSKAYSIGDRFGNTTQMDAIA